MKVKRGWRSGSYINIFLCHVRSGVKRKAKVISIEEENFYYMCRVVMKYVPEFDIYDLFNPVKSETLFKIIEDLEKILEWMETGSTNTEIEYYIELFASGLHLRKIEERIKFFKQLIRHLKKFWKASCGNYLYYINIEGI